MNLILKKRNWKNFSILSLIVAVFITVFTFAPSQAYAQNEDIQEIEEEANALSENQDVSPAFRMIERGRGFAVILLLIALVVSALYAAFTGNTKAGIFVAIGAVILFGGFWILTIVVDSFSGGEAADSTQIENVGEMEFSEVEVEEAPSRSGISLIIAQFVGQGINILTTFIAPIIIIYGIILSISIAMGESNPETFRNYILGFIFALMAMFLAQLFRAPLI